MLFMEYSTGSEKIKWLSGYRMVLSILVFYLQDNVADWELPAPCITSIILHVTRLGKNKNSKFEAWLLLNEYDFCIIIKSKSC